MVMTSGRSEGTIKSAGRNKFKTLKFYATSLY